MRRHLNQSGVLHSLKAEQIAKLEEIFAQLTETGWVVPAWIKELT